MFKRIEVLEKNNKNWYKDKEKIIDDIKQKKSGNQNIQEKHKQLYEKIKDKAKEK